MAPSTDRTDPWGQVLEILVDRLEGDPLLIEDALAQAAARPADRRNLRNHLLAAPHALTNGASDGPPILDRLTQQLVARGFFQVRMPQCVQCHRAVTLRYRVPGGRLCTRCFANNNTAPCVHCGKTKPVSKRDDDGGALCQTCSAPTAPCATCRRDARIVTRTAAGEPLCQKCAPRPTYPCTTCGILAPAQAIIDDGPVCRDCYQQPKRECGTCGKVRRITLRASGDQPDTCSRCYKPPITACPDCGQRLDCGHDLPDGLEPMTKPDDVRVALLRRLRSAPRLERICALCSKARPVHARWPLGNVCNACYTRELGRPATCSTCGQEAVLTGTSEAGRRCGPCAGSTLDYRCVACDQPGRMYSQSHCVDCSLETKLIDLLGEPSPTLEPLRTALLMEPDARGVLRWITRRPIDELLRSVATEPTITHATLDTMGTVRMTGYLRALLVEVGVLPARNEALERTATWLTSRFDTVPAEHKRLVRPFAEWTLMRRARRRDRAGKFTVASGKFLRLRVETALHLLDWLDQHEWTLAELRQRDVDLYLASGSTTRYQVRDFIHWAALHREAPKVTVPLRHALRPMNAYDDDARWAQAKTLLNDVTIPLDQRVAGCLALIYGQHLSRIVTWTTDRVEINDDTGVVSLRFDKIPVTLLEPLDKLVLQLVDERSGRERSKRIGDWLFPGAHPGRHTDPESLRVLLGRRGINLRDSRNAALGELASDIPAPVLAELLGLHDNTAVAWVKSTQQDWSGFVAVTNTRRRATS